MVNQYERVEEADPRRCQHTIPTRGQCNLVSVEGSKYCIAHGGASIVAQNGQKELRNYRLSKFKSKFQHDESAPVKDLRDEIVIMRQLLTEKIDHCEDSHDLILQSGPLSDLIMKIEKLVTSCSRLETHLGKMLDTTQALQWAAETIEIISRHVEDQDALTAIADELMASHERLIGSKGG